MKIRQLLLFFIFTVFVSSKTFAQDQRFDVGLIAGFNFSELEGNSITDYVGLNMGIVGRAKIGQISRIGIEFLFSQNGEYILPEFYPLVDYGKVRLNHLEIPIYMDWEINIQKKEKSHDLNINIGLAYTRLLSHSAEDVNKKNITDQIIYDDRDAFIGQAGFIYRFTQNLGLNLKASLPIRKVGLSWTLAARLIYMFG